MKIRGQSLVTVLVAAAIGSVVLVALMAMMKSLLGSTQNIQQSGNWIDNLNNARAILTHSSLCTCNLTRNGTSALNFPSANAASTVFPLANLSNFDAACTSPGNPVVQVTSTAPTGSDIWVSEMQLMNFFIIDAQNASAVLRIRGRKTGATKFALLKDFNVYFKTTTVGGVVTLNSCGPASQSNLVCTSHRTLGTLGAGPPAVSHSCPSPTQVMTQCQTIADPSGGQVCDSHPMAGRDSAGRAYCATAPCTATTDAAGHPQTWNIYYTCCDIVPAP